MAIFDEKKMEQKPVYPTKKTPSYADWALFNMGKELEESIPSGLTVDQEVIAGSTNAVAGGAVKTYVDTEVAGVNEVPDSTAADVNKILTVDANGEPNWSTPLTPQVTVDQTVIAGSTNPVSGGAVYDELANISEVPASSTRDEGKVLTVDSEGNASWEEPSSPQITVDQTVIAGSTNPVAGGAVYSELASINEVPGSNTGDIGKVLTVDSNGNANWQTPSGSSITLHTYTFASELANDIISHPYAHIEYPPFSSEEVMLVTGHVIYSNSSARLSLQMYSSGWKFSSLIISASDTTKTSFSITLNPPTSTSGGVAKTLNVSSFKVYY